MDKKKLTKACLELASVNVGLARVLMKLAEEVPAPRKPPARECRVIEMKRAAGE